MEVEPVTIAIEWPVLPAPQADVVLVEGVVYMSLEYWMHIVEYVVEVERIKAIIGEEIER